MHQKPSADVQCVIVVIPVASAATALIDIPGETGRAEHGAHNMAPSCRPSGPSLPGQRVVGPPHT